MQSIAYSRSVVRNKFGLREKELKKLHQWLETQQNIQPPPFVDGKDMLVSEASLQLRKALKNRVLADKLANLKIYDILFNGMTEVNRGTEEDPKYVNAWEYTVVFNDKFFARSQIVKDDFYEPMNVIDVLSAALVEIVEKHEDHLVEVAKERAEKMEAMDYEEPAQAVGQSAAPTPIVQEVTTGRKLRRAAKLYEQKQEKKRMKELMNNGKLAEMYKADLQRKQFLKRAEQQKELETKLAPKMTEEQVKHILQAQGRIPMTV